MYLVYSTRTVSLKGGERGHTDDLEENQERLEWRQRAWHKSTRKHLLFTPAAVPSLEFHNGQADVLRKKLAEMILELQKESNDRN